MELIATLTIARLEKKGYKSDKDIELHKEFKEGSYPTERLAFKAWKVETQEKIRKEYEVKLGVVKTSKGKNGAVTIVKL